MRKNIIKSEPLGPAPKFDSLTDQSPSQSCFITKNGFVQSVITRLMSASTQQEYNALAQSIGVIDSVDFSKDLSTEDIMNLIKPRYVQSDGDIASYNAFVQRYLHDKGVSLNSSSAVSSTEDNTSTQSENSSSDS